MLRIQKICLKAKSNCFSVQTRRSAYHSCETCKLYVIQVKGLA